MSAKKTINRTYRFSTTGLLVFCGAFALIGAFFLWQAFAATTCLVSNRTAWSDGVVDCTVGTTITRTNAAFACNQPLSSYGTLPIKVVITSTTAWEAAGSVTLDNGCVGDNNPDTIDLVVDIQGNGARSTTGNGQDSFKTRQSPGPRDIQVTGRMECGGQAPGAHQDMMQFQGGSNITIVNATSGNYTNGTSTCQGAGGVIFSSAVSNLDILGGSFMGCNHGILGGSASSNPNGEVRDTKFRSGRTDGSDPNCTGFSASPPCQSDLPMANVTCGRWSASRWIDEVINPSNNPPPPPPPSTAPTVSLTANPTSITTGQASTLTWSTTNATTCTASGAWNGSRSTSGNQSVSPTATSTYTLTCTGSGGSANGSVTVTVSSTPPPPPTSGGVTCTTQNYWNAAANQQAWTWDQCRAGTTINLRNTEWHCNRPLTEYGTLPIKVISKWDSGGNATLATSVNAGCTGTAGNDINLIIQVDNEGGGLITDVFKTRGSPGPQNIRMTGYLEGGARNPADHQDCIQLQGGQANYLVNVECPNYDSGQATVQGAGGALFFSINNSQMTVLGGKYIGCNHALNVHAGGIAAGSRIINAKFRSANTTTAFCSGFSASPPCVGPGLSTFAEFTNVSCQRYTNGQWVEEGDSNPNPPPPPPTDTPPSVSITAPTDGSNVSGTVAVNATATDNNSVSRVEFYIDGTLRGTDTSSPYSYSWNTTSLSNGNHSVMARAHDAASNSSSDQHTVTVQNGDTTPPSTPTGLSATASAYNRVNLSWTASTDNTAVAGYYIVRNGTTIATTTGTGTTYADTTVNASTAYTYQVIARDSAGNNSPASSTANVTTPAVPTPADTIPPSTPTNLTATAVSSTQINLSWRASTDNTGVVGYDIYRSTSGSAATLIASVTTTSFGNTNLSASTAYSYYVSARDAAGNRSVPSTTVTATTLAAPVPPGEPGATTGSLSGVVRTTSGAGIDRANVNIVVNGSTKYYRTSSTGTYRITGLPAGTFSTKYKATNHQHQYIDNTVSAGQNTTKNVTLLRR